MFLLFFILFIFDNFCLHLFFFENLVLLETSIFVLETSSSSTKLFSRFDMVLCRFVCGFTKNTRVFLSNSFFKFSNRCSILFFPLKLFDSMLFSKFLIFLSYSSYSFSVIVFGFLNILFFIYNIFFCIFLYCSD